MEKEKILKDRKLSENNKKEENNDMVKVRGHYRKICKKLKGKRRLVCEKVRVKSYKRRRPRFKTSKSYKRR